MTNVSLRKILNVYLRIVWYYKIKHKTKWYLSEISLNVSNQNHLYYTLILEKTIQTYIYMVTQPVRSSETFPRKLNSTVLEVYPCIYYIRLLLYIN